LNPCLWSPDIQADERRRRFQGVYPSAVVDKNLEEVSLPGSRIHTGHVSHTAPLCLKPALEIPSSWSCNHRGCPVVCRHHRGTFHKLKIITHNKMCKVGMKRAPVVTMKRYSWSRSYVLAGKILWYLCFGRN
jgi:hypothetical protein